MCLIGTGHYQAFVQPKSACKVFCASLTNVLLCHIYIYIYTVIVPLLVFHSLSSPISIICIVSFRLSTSSFR